jgi:uncharacterized protein YceK
MNHAFIVAILLAGCSGIPVQISKTSQEQKQTSKQEVAQDVAQDQAQTSAHQSESKQGTNSMPVIIICNTNGSQNARCATVPEDGPIKEQIRRQGK